LSIFPFQTDQQTDQEPVAPCGYRKATLFFYPQNIYDRDVNVQDEANLIQIIVQLLILLGVAVVAVVIASYIRRRSVDSGNVAFRDLDPGDLSSLQRKGLLTEDEARRLQSVIAQRAIEDLEKRKEPAPKKVELQDLLAEAEKARQSSLQRSNSSPGEKPE